MEKISSAKYFAENPSVPLDKIKGMINLDSLTVGEENPNVLLIGGEDGKLGNVLKKVASQLNRKVIPDPLAQKGYFYRSDHFPLVLKGVPALAFLDIGWTDPDYLVYHYHETSDQYHPEWPLDGLVQDLKLYTALIEELGNLHK